jgi:hypothetical protein
MPTGFLSHGPESSQVFLAGLWRPVHKSNIILNETRAVTTTDSSLTSVDGDGKVNTEGVAYYSNLIDYLLQKGIACN